MQPAIKTPRPNLKALTAAKSHPIGAFSSNLRALLYRRCAVACWLLRSLQSCKPAPATRIHAESCPHSILGSEVEIVHKGGVALKCVCEIVNAFRSNRIMFVS